MIVLVTEEEEEEAGEPNKPKSGEKEKGRSRVSVTDIRYTPSLSLFSSLYTYSTNNHDDEGDEDGEATRRSVARRGA